MYTEIRINPPVAAAEAKSDAKAQRIERGKNPRKVLPISYLSLCFIHKVLQKRILQEFDGFGIFSTDRLAIQFQNA